MIRVPPSSPPVPYAPLFRSCRIADAGLSRISDGAGDRPLLDPLRAVAETGRTPADDLHGARLDLRVDQIGRALNSSHRCISYAVFCLKKKNKTKRTNN